MKKAEEFKEIYSSNITREGSRSLLQYLETTSNFFQDPASTRFHLSAPGGLVVHSINVYERLKWLCEVEKKHQNLESPIASDESICIVSLLHDLCKADTYTTQPKNFKNYDTAVVHSAPTFQVKHDSHGDFIWDTKMEYVKLDKFPFGHGEKSVYLIQKFMKLTDEEALAIRYHMGSWNSAEASDAGTVFGKYPLAFLLHVADEYATFVDET